MTREEYQKTIKTFTKEQKRLKALKKGQKVYITDVYYDFFDCEVLSVDLKGGTVEVVDHSMINIEPGDYFVWQGDDGEYSFSKLDGTGHGIDTNHGNLEELYKDLPNMTQNRFTDDY